MGVRSPAWPAIVSALAVVGIVVVAVSGHDVPAVLGYVAAAGAGGSAGLAVPKAQP